MAQVKRATHVCCGGGVGGKATVPRALQDEALTAWGRQEAGDRALLYERSARVKALPPAPRNAAAVLIRSRRGSWRPRALWTRSLAPPTAGGVSVSVPASEARSPQPALGGHRSCR